MPDTPTGLSATPKGEATIELGWNAGAGAAHYEIEINNEEALYSDVLTVWGVVTVSERRYIHKYLRPGDLFSYRLRAVDAEDNESGWTEPVLARTEVRGSPEVHFAGCALRVLEADRVYMSLDEAPTATAPTVTYAARDRKEVASFDGGAVSRVIEFSVNSADQSETIELPEAIIAELKRYRRARRIFEQSDYFYDVLVDGKRIYARATKVEVWL